MPTLSAGLLPFRRRPVCPEVLLGHMGGPFWAKRDRAWTLPKGEIEPGEDPHAAALREFAEELGTPPPAPSTPDLDLGEIRQKAGKTVRAWARQGSFDAAAAVSNTVEIEWPPRSGRRIEVPELDRADWLGLDDARGLIVAAQAERLARTLHGPAAQPLSDPAAEPATDPAVPPAD